MKGYPSWFNTYNKPTRPAKPQPPKQFYTTEQQKELARMQADDWWSGVSLKSLVASHGEDALLKADSEGTYYNETDHYIVVFKLEQVQIENHNFKNDMINYKKRLARYPADVEKFEQRLKEWTELNAKYKIEQAEKTKRRELAVLAKLEKKYKNEAAN